LPGIGLAAQELLLAEVYILTCYGSDNRQGQELRRKSRNVYWRRIKKIFARSGLSKTAYLLAIGVFRIADSGGGNAGARELRLHGAGERRSPATTRDSANRDC